MFKNPSLVVHRFPLIHHLLILSTDRPHLFIMASLDEKVSILPQPSSKRYVRDPTPLGLDAKRE